MESFVEVQATMPKSSEVIYATICPTKISVKTEKTYKAKKMMEILNIIVALLNSGGGKLVLSYERSPPPTHIMDCVRMIEQKIEMLIGCAKMVSKIRKSSYPNRIDFLVKASDGLITLNYNLCLPTKAQVLAVPSTDPPEELKNVIDGQNSLVCKELSSYEEDFFKGQYVGFEEDDDVQFKSLKAGATKCVTLADRVVNKSNKLASYVSAFANHRGGHVYYGIDDNGIVEGEEVSNKDEIIRKVDKAMNKLIWPDHCCKPQRGQEWAIFFVPVKNSEGEVIPSIFVIVIAVACCSGGVFINVPESYHIIQGNVEQMSLKVWKTKLSASAIPSATEDNQPLATSDRLGKETPACPVQVSTVPTHRAQTNSEDESCSDVSKQFDAPYVHLNACRLAVQQTSALQPSQGPSHIWSSAKNRDSFISLTIMLVKFRNNDNMTDFHRLSKWIEKTRPQSNACVVAVKAEKIAVAYKNHQFQTADRLLEKLDELVQKFVKDALMLESRVLYLKSRVKRAEGNFEQSYEIAMAGLQKVQLIQPGFISVWSYLNAAFLANVLSNQERDDKKCEALKKEERTFLEWAQRDALTLKHVPAEMIDLEQKLHIYQAMSYLGCPLTGEASNGPHHTPPEDLKNASLHLDEVYKLGEDKLTHFRKIQCLFVKSDLLRQRSASSSHPDRDCESLCHCVEKALELARKHHFEEMIEYSEKRLEAFVRDSSNDNDSEWLKDLGVDCLTELEN